MFFAGAIIVCALRDLINGETLWAVAGIIVFLIDLSLGMGWII